MSDVSTNTCLCRAIGDTLVGLGGCPRLCLYCCLCLSTKGHHKLVDVTIWQFGKFSFRTHLGSFAFIVWKTFITLQWDYEHLKIYRSYVTPYLYVYSICVRLQFHLGTSMNTIARFLVLIHIGLTITFENHQMCVVIPPNDHERAVGIDWYYRGWRMGPDCRKVVKLFFPRRICSLPLIYSLQTNNKQRHAAGIL